MYQLEIRLSGVKEAELMLARGSRAVNDQRPAFNQIADDLMRIIGLNFTSQGRRGGGSWGRIDEDWSARKVREGHDERILFASHALYNSLVHRGDENQKLRVTHSYIELESKLPYADRQNKDRPFMTFLQSDSDRWARFVVGHIVSAMSGVRRV